MYLLVFNVFFSFAQEKDNKKSVAFLPKIEFSFNSVPEGTDIKHDFIIENKGSAGLEIYNVSGG
jgi:hypothetical protein